MPPTEEPPTAKDAEHAKTENHKPVFFLKDGFVTQSDTTGGFMEDWREVVRNAAHEASVSQTRARREGGAFHYNYRWEHVQAVVRLAVRLATLTGADPEIVEAAAWLHDVAKGEATDHGQAGADAARRILATTDFPPHKIPAVAHAIAQHVGLWRDQPVEPLEAALLWDADKLTKLGATAVLHFTADFADEGQGQTKALIDALPGEDWQPRTVESLHTAPARAAGEKRLSAYRAFCHRAAREYHGDDLI
jgi:uncharacterized protein